ncbi:MAG: sulfate permease [Hyphomicrobiaceae bacterium]
MYASADACGTCILKNGRRRDLVFFGGVRCWAHKEAARIVMDGARGWGVFGKSSIKAVLAVRWRAFAENPKIQQSAPILTWLPNYKREDLPSDMTAGIVVAIMLIPQGMAYALLAGLPPAAGLYTSILPHILYSIFGTSRTMGMGPVALISLMVGTTLAPLAAIGSDQYANYALVLALLSGVMLTLLGLIRAGFLTNFISHPVISGFTTAAAFVIGFSQASYLLGLELQRTHFIPSIVAEIISKVHLINPITMTIGSCAIVALLVRAPVVRGMQSLRFVNAFWADLLPKILPLLIVLVATLVSWYFGLAARGVKVVGDIPSGLPAITVPHFDSSISKQLVSGALLIGLVSFLESVSVARTLASKRRQKIMPDQELIGVGVANIAAAFTGGYPVAGSFTRSVINFATGARTQVAGITTALLIVLTLLFFAPIFYHLPQAVLAATIVTAVTGLIDFSALTHTWKYMKLDAVSFLATFLAVLVLGVEEGILVGIGVSIVFFLWRTSQPALIVLGRLGDTQLYRDERAHSVTTYENVLMLRVDMSLYFANAAHIEDFVLRYIADHPKVEDFVLVCSAVNMIDASALETLESLKSRLKDGGVTMHLAAVKSSILKRLNAVNFFEKLAPGRIFVSAHDAAVALAGGASNASAVKVLDAVGEKQFS